MTNTKIYVATKAVIENNGKILIIKPSEHQSPKVRNIHFEFPGGRVKDGHKYLDALKQRVYQEAGLEVEPIKLLEATEWFRETDEGVWHIVALFFLCKANNTRVILSKDHQEYKWIEPKEYKKYNIYVEEHKIVETFLKEQEEKL